MSIAKLIDTVKILDRPGLSPRVQTALLLDARDLIEMIVSQISPGSQLQPSLFEQVKSAFFNGFDVWPAGKITAIKKYRSMSGCSLKDAKEAVELMMANNKWTEKPQE